MQAVNRLSDSIHANHKAMLNFNPKRFEQSYYILIQIQHILVKYHIFDRKFILATNI